MICVHLTTIVCIRLNYTLYQSTLRVWALGWYVMDIPKHQDGDLTSFSLFVIPSGKRLHSYGRLPISYKWAKFNGHVELTEGTWTIMYSNDTGASFFSADCHRLTD